MGWAVPADTQECDGSNPYLHMLQMRFHRNPADLLPSGHRWRDRWLDGAVGAGGVWLLARPTARGGHSKSA